jgi:hypothetical protein
MFSTIMHALQVAFIVAGVIVVALLVLAVRSTI